MKASKPEVLREAKQSQNEKEKRQEKESILTFALHKSAIKDWLLKFAQCVRDRDYVAAGGLFCLNVVGFGSKARRVVGLPALMTEQWKETWEKTSGFEFNFDELDFFHDAHIAHIAVTWQSYGHRFGTKFKRRGRASLLLLGANDKLKCAASHFSLDP